MRKIVQIAMLIALLLPAVQAQEQDCINTAESQLALNTCTQSRYQAVDAELNTLFHEVRQRIGDDANTHNLLRNGERAWIAFRDAECIFSTSKAVGGSAYSMLYDMCLIDITQQRIVQFRKYLNCEEGDLSCPLSGTDEQAP